MDGLCPELDTTCCTNKDFSELKSWWQLPLVGQNSCSRQQIRQNQQSSILYYTKSILQNLKNFDYLANKILKAKQYSSEKCTKAAHNFIKFYNKEIIPNPNLIIKNFINDKTKCFNLLNKLQTNILCGLCNPKWDSTFKYLSKNIIYMNQQSCMELSSNCRKSVATN